jgi:hypothetical protein
MSLLVFDEMESYVEQELIIINANSKYEKVAEHKKIDGFEQYKIDIMHYLSTFTKKPGALKTHAP